jgi:hypothetical protein
MLLLLIASAVANEPVVDLQPTLQVRPRVEAHTGKDGAAGGEALFITQRSRLGLDASAGEVFGRVSIQDVRLWGTETSTIGDFSADAVDFHEAYLGWRATESLTIEAGRQEITFEEHRLVGSVNWTSQARSFDALKLSLDTNGFNADVAAVMMGEDSGGLVEQDQVSVFLRAGVTPGETGTIDLVSITDQRRDFLRETVGLYAKGGTGILSGRVEAYAQVGHSDDDSIMAWMVAAQGTIAPALAMKPKVTLWYDLLSGDDDATDGTQEAFNTLYATNHKFYGHMDVMAFRLGAMADGRGLHDAALKLSAKPTDTLSVKLDAHVYAAAAGDDGLIAEELDLWLAVPLAPKLDLAAGAAGMLYADGADPDLFGWLQLDAKL